MTKLITTEQTAKELTKKTKQKKHPKTELPTEEKPPSETAVCRRKTPHQQSNTTGHRMPPDMAKGTERGLHARLKL
jgi:hypothetical protein